MKKIISIILICLSVCSYGQTLQNVFNHSVAHGQLFPMVDGHGNPYVLNNFGFYNINVTDTISGQNSDITMAAGYYSLNSAGIETNGIRPTSSVTFAAEGLALSAGEEAIIIMPDYFKIMAKSSDTAPVTFVMHPPTMESITITDIAVWDSDTLKRVHLAAPLTVRGFKTLITQK